MIRQSAPAATFCRRRGGLAERVRAVDELPGADAQPARVEVRDELRRELRPDVAGVRALDVDGRHPVGAGTRGDGVEVAAVGLRELPDPHAVAAHDRGQRAVGGRGEGRSGLGAPTTMMWRALERRRARSRTVTATRPSAVPAGTRAVQPAPLRRSFVASAPSGQRKVTRMPEVRPRPRSWIWRPAVDAHGLPAGGRRGRDAAQPGQPRGGRRGLRGGCKGAPSAARTGRRRRRSRGRSSTVPTGQAHRSSVARGIPARRNSAVSARRRAIAARLRRPLWRCPPSAALVQVAAALLGGERARRPAPRPGQAARRAARRPSQA